MSRTEGTFEIHYYYVTIGGMASELRNRGSYWKGFASGAAASLISGAVGGVCGPQHLNVPVVWAKTAMIAAGGLAGGVSASIAGGDFWDGVCNGIICAGLNHALHYVAKNVTGPDDPPKTIYEKKAWDLNGDGKLSKIEADHWWQTGRGKPISVDNSKIDWGDLEIPDGCEIGKRFAIETSDSYRVFPIETAMTYGGTSFEVIGANEVKVVDQLYHYDLRSWNSFENGIRNVATWLGMPQPSTVGVNYMIHYEQPNIIIK